LKGEDPVFPAEPRRDLALIPSNPPRSSLILRSQ
jgi:hypothetical protein